MSATVFVVMSAVAVNGLLAGASLDQSVKQLPARKRIGAIAYSTYASAADLANGIAFYAVLGVGAALLSVAAAVVVWLGASDGARLPAALLVLFTVLHCRIKRRWIRRVARRASLAARVSDQVSVRVDPLARERIRHSQ